jgi:hypothetical protein
MRGIPFGSTMTLRTEAPTSPEVSPRETRASNTVVEGASPVKFGVVALKYDRPSGV